MEEFYLLDYIALLSLICCWTGYLLYIKYNINHTSCNNIFTATYNLRKHWALNITMHPDNPRIADTQIINILQRNISFYITITIFIIAGLMAMMASSNVMISILHQLPYQISNSQATINIKVLIILIIFIVAFFRLSWALRQSRYYAIAIISLPHSKTDEKKCYKVAEHLATLSALAGKSFHNAYYSYYFGLAALSWLIHPLLFIIINIAVLMIIYRREFKSNSFRILRELDSIYNDIR